MIIKMYSAITVGIDSRIIPIEIDSEPYTHFALSVLGLSEYFASQMKKRIEIACKNNGIELPAIKITVNLGQFHGDKSDIIILDLPIALGILKILKMFEDPHCLITNSVIVGELGLDGVIRPIKGALSIAIECAAQNKISLIVPMANTKEIEIVEGVNMYGVYSLKQIIDNQEIKKVVRNTIPRKKQVYTKDFSEVRGQAMAKRAMVIAAAGHHNIIFMGPPGSGKTMLAERLSTIMPPMSYEESLETSRIYSSLGSFHDLILERPYRSPHHTTTLPGLLGGGINPAPGEISLANNGILFLDEFTEFTPKVLESLRQPLESQHVKIIRRSQTITYPARFLLVAAFNPCPCGYAGDTKRKCECSRLLIAHYLAKISGPILDRIDLQVALRAVEYSEVESKTPELSSEQMALMVSKATRMQNTRFGDRPVRNGTMTVADIELCCSVTPEAQELIKKAFDVLKLSMRGYHKVLRIARTIADLEESELIQEKHIKEALTYRALDQSIAKLKNV